MVEFSGGPEGCGGCGETVDRCRCDLIREGEVAELAELGRAWVRAQYSTAALWVGA